MNLPQTIPMVTDDVPGMHRICQRIAERRQREADTLPPPSDWPALPNHQRKWIVRGLCIALAVIQLAAWLFALALNLTAQNP
jgi:hypothetical protein